MDGFTVALLLTVWQVACDGCLRGQLPVLDTGACLPRPVCNPQSRFRTPDGSCTNLLHPMWAQVSSPFARLKPATYDDGMKEFRHSVNGFPLPPVRQISYSYFPDRFAPDLEFTLNLMQFGQLIAHDVTHLRNRVLGDGSPIKCCTNNGQFLQPGDYINENCMPIEVPWHDPFYGQFNVRCLDFIRAGNVENGTCCKYPIEQENLLTHIIDASMVYGSDSKTALSLRSFTCGKLRIQLSDDGRPFPPNSKNAESDCRNPPNENICYVAGDDRANQNIGITLFQILFLRLHNIICDKLHYINSKWSDERLYQETRKIVGALIQHIAFKTFLPIILGEQYMLKKGLLVDPRFNMNYYDPDVNPSTLNEFAGAAYRSFHSLVPREIVMYNEHFKEYAFIFIDHFYFRPTIIQEPGVFDALLRGLAHQSPQKFDDFFSIGITNFLFDNNDIDDFGTDEESFDTIRGRDLGLPSYNQMKVICGFKRARCFEDFSDFISEESIQKLKYFYFHPDDVDLFVGGMMERLIPGTMVGPTFQCIIGEQFYNYMRGDRFYYENSGLPWSFTRDQLHAIYEVSLAWIFCEASDAIESIPHDVFRRCSLENPIILCKDIRPLDLRPWKELF